MADLEPRQAEGVHALKGEGDLLLAVSDGGPFIPEVLVAADGSKLLKTPPDIIIADYRLQDGENGIEAVAILREKLGAYIPAFIMSGDTSTDALQEVKRSNLTMLHKPVEDIVLRHTIANLGRRSTPTPVEGG